MAETQDTNPARAPDQGTLAVVAPQPSRPSDAPTFVLGYRKAMVDTAKAHGLSRARRSDPDAFDAAVRAIETLADEGRVFSADDVRSMLGGTAGPFLGSAFNHCRRQGLIVMAGVTTSESISRHGSLVRTWRGSRWT